MAEPTPEPTPPVPAAPLLRLDPLLVLVWGVLSCGLYFLWWNARVARVLNAAAGREVMAPALASLSALCGPLHLYFFYVVGEALPLLRREEERARMPDRTTPLLVLGYFFTPVAAMIVQRQLNEFFDARP